MAGEDIRRPAIVFVRKTRGEKRATRDYDGFGKRVH